MAEKARVAGFGGGVITTREKKSHLNFSSIVNGSLVQ
jgi:hypothetical protein